jgi:sucrose-6-phosphatase
MGYIQYSQVGNCCGLDQLLPLLRNDINPIGIAPMNETYQPANLPPSLTSNVSKEATDFLLAEYAALRAEILNRTEIQHQLISLALIAAGTFLTVGLQGSPTVTLAYPILAVFLAAAWAQNDTRVHQIGLYIKKRIEKRILEAGLGWEHAVPSTRIGRLGSLTLLASRGVFVGTEIMAVSIRLLKLTFPFPTEDIVLIIIDGIAIMLTVFLLKRHTVRLARPTFQPTEPDKLFLLAVDIDETLLGDEDGELSLKIFARDYPNSFLLAVVTGRTLSSVQQLINDGRLPQPDYIGSSVGTELYRRDKTIYCLDQKYAARVSREWSLETIYTLGEGEGIRRQEFGENQPLFHAGFEWDGQPSTLDAFRKRLAKQSGCCILPSSNKYIDVLPDRLGKGEVVRFLQQELQVDPSRVVVAGDSGNDKGMFETSFKGIIPVNAQEELKIVACQPRHYQSSFPAALGVMYGLYHFGFVEQV